MTLYIFDKDGTLVRARQRLGAAPKPVLTCEEQVLLPGVFEKLAELRAAGHRLAIASNQDAVAAGLISADQAKALAQNCADKLGGVDAWRISPYNPRAKKKLHGQPNRFARDDETRKPHPGMILSIMAELGCAPVETIMVGNSRNDRKAARAAGVRYLKISKLLDR